MPGAAGSTPVIVGDRIFVTSVSGSDLLLICVSTDGKELWQKTIATGNTDVRGDEGSSASPSASTDGKHVWTVMANGMFGCYSLEGDEVYRFNLQDRYGPFNIAFGMTSTPVLDNGRLYFQFIHGEGIRIHRSDGRLSRRRDRRRDLAATSNHWSREENEHSYASPMLYRDSEREFLITHGGDYVMAHSLKDGSEIWRCCLNPQGASPSDPSLRRLAAGNAGNDRRPVCQGKVLICVRTSKAMSPDNKSALHWKRDAGTPDVPSPLYHDGLVYLCRENGNLVCVDAKTGEEFYEERTTRDRHRASPLYADGRCISPLVMA
ncbi:MAG: PQQ-like beta-propeller repeat protein [Planctomycetaceae bacterium]|nr:PQQ-like beta-propeller repeat protein [Planctomycetaceae bacterium]